jgi:hypothetical protein
MSLRDLLEAGGSRSAPLPGIHGLSIGLRTRVRRVGFMSAPLIDIHGLSISPGNRLEAGGPQ